MGIQPKFHLINRNNCFVKSYINYVLARSSLRSERRQYCNFLKSIRFSNGFADGLAKKVYNDHGNLYSLKSHDCHILLQRILLVVVRPYLTKQIHDTLVEQSQFFLKLTSKTVHVRDLQSLHKGIVLVLCKLERIFPPAFFTTMVNLAVIFFEKPCWEA